MSSSCSFCAKGLTSPHFCAACGSPQPVRAGESPFEAFEVSEHFSQDHAVLEKRFYDLSRKLHPDRFASASPEVRRASMERMSFLNESYSMLRDPATLRQEILRRNGVAAPKGQPPVELAEEWFELQEGLMDDPEGAASRIREFAHRLVTLKAELAARTFECQSEFDAGGGVDALKRLASVMQEDSYLASLERDLQRLTPGRST